MDESQPLALDAPAVDPLEASSILGAFYDVESQTRFRRRLVTGNRAEAEVLMQEAFPGA